MIPKIIWQTHNYRQEDLPDYFKKSTRTWKNLNPDWEHRYVDSFEREEFVKLKSPKLYELYLNSRPQAQSDIWRLLALYEFGGVYADMDSTCVKPLDNVLEKYTDQNFVSVKRYKDGFINIAHFAVPERSERLLKIIESSVNDLVVVPDWHVWISFNKHLKDLDESSQFFDAEDHSEELKSSFYEPKISYYGKNMSYKDYLKNILKLDEENYLQSVV